MRAPNAIFIAALLAIAVVSPAGGAAVPERGAAGVDDDGDGRDAALQIDAALEAWGYLNLLTRAGDSLLNPGNAIARLPSSQRLLDARANLQLKSGMADALLQPRLLATHNTYPGGADSSNDDVYLSQAFVRARPGQQLTLTGGRFRFTWGPANFRSPSNPFYFDAGKNQPLLDVPGIDLLRVDYSAAPAKLTAAWVAGAGHLAGRTDIDDVALLKLDHAGDALVASAIAAARSGGKPFVGAYAQFNASDALMLYGELGHGQRPVTLQLPALPAGTPVVASPSAPATSALAGASYTLQNGQVLSVEYLYDGHGYDRDGEARYFALAADRAQAFQSGANAGLRAQAAAALGQLLSQSPALLGRHYGYLLWQSNPQDTGFYWRAALAGNLQDHSTQALLYVEKNLSRRVSVFGSAMVNGGSARSEFGAISNRSVSLGAKFFMF